MSLKKKNLVILHLFYQEMWEDISKYIDNLVNIADVDIYITTCSENKDLFQNIIEKYKTLNVTIDVLDNLGGADIWPFLFVINKINLNDYDVIFKLHTKQCFETLSIKLPKEIKIGFFVGLNLWRDFLFTSILGKSCVKKTIEIFNKNDKIGMVSFGPLSATMNANEKKYVKELSGLSYDKEFKHYVGTIFAIRPNLLSCIQNKFSAEDFINKSSEKFSKLAYDMEQLFGYLVVAQGYRYYSFFNGIHKIILSLLSHKKLKLIYMYYVEKFILR